MTKRSLILLVWAVLLCGAAAAQNVDEERYYLYSEREEEVRALPAMDPSLFFEAMRFANDLYASEGRSLLPDITIHRRGEGYEREQSTLFGIETPYRHSATWRLLGLNEEEYGGLHFSEEGFGSTGGVRRFTTTDAEPLEPFRVAARYVERNYRFGAQLTFRKRSRNGSLVALAADYRTGRDAQIEGVFTDAVRVGALYSRTWRGDLRWEVAADLPLSMRGMRSASTEEAFGLTNNDHYNPSWGYQNGKVRNARVRREVMPTVLTAVTLPLWPATRLRLSAGAEIGVRRQSALGWYDARTPLPDNYRKMPSYAGDRATEEVWRSADPRYTQIDWDELFTINRLGGGEAAYALEDRTTQSTNLQLRAAFCSEVGLWRFDYGLAWQQQSDRSFKTMRDLLGADYLTDIDQYLIDDDSYANRLENNLRAPSRRIGEGDRFGYDYALNDTRSTLWCKAAWRNHQWSAEAALALHNQTLFRRGYYEKELFPEHLSYGRSRTIRLQPYQIKGLVGYTATPRDYTSLILMLGAEAPAVEHLFIQPLYNNRTVNRPQCATSYGAELTHRHRGEAFEWQLTCFATMHLDGTQTMRYFDDLSGSYADLTLAGIGTSSLGIEAAARWRINYHWMVAATASWGAYRYIRDPKLTIVTDTDNQPIDVAATSHAGACRIGGAPEKSATVQLTYNQRGWNVRLSAGWAADRYVDPDFVRRTDRVARQNGTTPEAFAAFVEQERLSDALSVDLSGSKSFRFAYSQLTLFLSVRNLLGQKMISYGYESARTRRVGSSAEALRLPQDNRYLYGAPRSVLLTVGYRF